MAWCALQPWSTGLTVWTTSIQCQYTYSEVNVPNHQHPFVCCDVQGWRACKARFQRPLCSSTRIAVVAAPCGSPLVAAMEPLPLCPCPCRGDENDLDCAWDPAGVLAPPLIAGTTVRSSR